MNKYFICFIILLFNYVLNDDCTNGDGTNCDRFTSGDSKCIPNLAKTGCEIAGGCGSGDAVPEGAITTDYCSNLKVTGSSDTCIPNIAKTNCEIAPSCESGNAVPAGTITNDYCDSLGVGADELCVPNGDRSNCKIAKSCTEVTTKATDSICNALTVTNKDKKCIKDGDKCIEKNKDESRALRFSLLLFIFTLLY